MRRVMAPDPNEVQRPHATFTRVTLLRVVGISVLASALGIALGLSINWFPVAASKQAGPIDTLWNVLLIASVPIFVTVVAVILTSVVKFRMRPGEEDLDGPPIHGNTRLEVVWTTIPALLLLGLVTYAYLVLHDIEKAPGKDQPPEIHVQVTGQQFDWTFKYETDANGRKIPAAKQIQTAQLFLPINQSVDFDVKSVDVLHDFWVPAFRMKIDAVPGITTHYRVTPTRAGQYQIVCAELCGLGHAFMRNVAHVLGRPDFDRWLAKQQSAQNKPAGSLAAGQAVFTGASGCSGCHTLAAAHATGQVGPDLDKVLVGKYHTVAFIKQSIVKPNAFITPGFNKNIMPPNFGTSLSPAKLNAVVNYLYSVTHK
jgi:cytochrome c oxidase subunit 2